MSRLCLRQVASLLRQSSFALLAFALLFAGSAFAASLPDWMQEVARAPLPAYPPDTKGVVLLDEEVTNVKDNGETFTVHRWAAKILRNEGKGLAGFAVDFSNETKITWMKAWSVDARGTVYELKEKDAIETAMLNDEAFSDLRHKIVDIPAAAPGTIVGFEYQQKHRPYVLEDSWIFQDIRDKVPVRKARFTINLPAGWEYQAYWSNYKGFEPTHSGNSYTWEVNDVPAVERQRDMPAMRVVAPRLVVNYRPTSEAAKNKAHNSWAEISTWYYNLANGQRQGTPETKARATALTAGAKTTLDKIRALAAFTQRDVRYVDIEIGIGGLQPHPAASVLAHRYGDCKDKVTLMSTMLHDIGIDSDYMLVDTKRGFVRPDIPSELSNHVIIAIHLSPSDVEAAALPAVYAHPKLGNLLIFDPTDEFTPVGYIPPHLQASYGLLVREHDGDIIKLPLLDASLNKLTRTANLSLDAMGTLQGSVQEIRTGAEARVARARMLRAKGTDRAKVLEDFLSLFLGSFKLTKATVTNLDAYDLPLVFNYDFVAPNYAKVAGNLLLVPPRVLGSKADDLLEDGKKRNFPVEFDAAAAHFDDFQIKLPPGYDVDELPDPTKVSYGFGQYNSKTAFENGTLRYQREFQVSSVLVPLENISDLQRFYRQIGRDERNTAVLKRKF